MIGINSKKFIAIIIGYIDIIFHSLVSFILTPLMISMWGNASYGVYKIILSFMTYFMLVDMGIKSTAIRFVSEYRVKNDKENEKKYIAVICSYYVITAIILTCIVFLFKTLIPRLYSNSLTIDEISIVKQSLPWLTIYTISTLFYNCFSALIRGHNKQIIIQVISIIRTINRFLVIFFALKNGASVVSAVLLDSIIAVIYAIIVVAYVFVIMKLPPKFNGINKVFIKNIFGFTTIMLFLTIADSLFWSTGNFFVGIMTSSTGVAIYATAITLTNIFQSLLSNVSHVLVPDIMLKSIKNSNVKEMNKMMIRVGKIKSYIMYPIIIGFVIYGKEFIELWVGTGYTGSYIIATLLMIIIYFGLIQDVPNNYVIAKNRHKKLTIVTIFSAFFNVLISVILVKYIGIYGAAIGTGVSYFITHVLYKYFWYKKEFGFAMDEFYKELIIKKVVWLIIIIIIGLLINCITFDINFNVDTINRWITLAIKLLLFCTIYLIILFYGFLSKSCRTIIINKIRRR